MGDISGNVTTMELERIIHDLIVDNKLQYSLERNEKKEGDYTLHPVDTQPALLNMHPVELTGDIDNGVYKALTIAFPLLKQDATHFQVRAQNYFNNNHPDKSLTTKVVYHPSQQPSTTYVSVSIESSELPGEEGVLQLAPRELLNALGGLLGLYHDLNYGPLSRRTI
jgi:hypothetical protein